MYNFFSKALTMTTNTQLCSYCDPRDKLNYLIRVEEFPSTKFILETIYRNSDNTMVPNTRSSSCIRSNSQIEIKLLNFNALLSHERVFLPKANIKS